jgi:hypothetical protein
MKESHSEPLVADEVVILEMVEENQKPELQNSE